MFYVICGQPLTPHSFSAILGKSIAQSNANEKGPIVRKMQIDNICSTIIFHLFFDMALAYMYYGWLGC